MKNIRKILSEREVRLQKVEQKASKGLPGLLVKLGISFKEDLTAEAEAEIDAQTIERITEAASNNE